MRTCSSSWSPRPRGAHPRRPHRDRARRAEPGHQRPRRHAQRRPPRDQDARRGGRPARPQRIVALAVSDTGTGMDEETAEHCFEPFYTTKGMAKGTGLGLAAVHAMVTQAGGQVSLDTAPGRGTTITLVVPRRRGRRGGLRGAGPRAGLAAAGDELVLVVEDEDELRRLAVRELEERGYLVLAAANGVEALAVAHSLERPVDLLVTDVVMPEMSGVELADSLVELWPDARRALRVRAPRRGGDGTPSPRPRCRPAAQAVHARTARSPGPSGPRPRRRQAQERARCRRHLRAEATGA